MQNSNEIRRLSAKWATGTGWPKRLEWFEIKGLRGWTGQRFELRYPIMAVVGENGVGKSSVLQAAASVYKSPRKTRFASDFYPDTAWETIKDASIRYSVREGERQTEASIRKPGERWRGNPGRPERHVAYIDLSRIQPVPARVGYTKLVKSHPKEISATLFDQYRLQRFSQIMGRAYDLAKMALTSAHATRTVPVLVQQGMMYSGFHQGAGETTMAELLETDLPQYSIALIDEVESSLHPRAQRRLIRDLAEKCRERELQVVLTTHSPYVLSELPPEARAYIMQVGHSREIIYGVSPEFAMTRMDDVPQPECDLYVEDVRAKTLLIEILVAHAIEVVPRCQIIPYGAASVGKALGQMIENDRFPRPSRVFLDGDQAVSPGCINLPGEDPPERVVFECLKATNWHGLTARVGRPFSSVADACERAMILTDHHEWVNDAANKLVLRGDILWQAMCAEWSNGIAKEEAAEIVRPVEDALIGIKHTKAPAPHPVRVEAPVFQQAPLTPTTTRRSESRPLPLFDNLPDVPTE
ncbi:MAG: AAA family ATPase [Bryobacteraceae bacterium]|jgi:predicted ATPase